MPPPTQTRHTWQSFAGRALAKYISYVYDHARIVMDPPDLHARALEAHPFILAMWHGQFMLVPKMRPEGIETQVMVARHGDAEVLGATLENLGSGMIRGAGAGSRHRDRGGAQALRAAICALNNDISVPMTAEVPPGPARKVSLGIIALARLSGRPIIAGACVSNRYLSLDTWSRLTINLPSARVGMAISEPIFVPKNADAAQLEVLRQEVEDQLNAANARAYELIETDQNRSLPVAMRTTHPDGKALRLYQYASAGIRHLAPAILSWRERQKKEDGARRDERLGRPSIPRPPGKLAWFHAASVGETNAVLPVIASLTKQHPDLNVLLSTGTVTSARLAAGRLGPNVIHQYIPLDVPRFMRQFIDHWQPDLAVFTESEIWPNLVFETKITDIPLVLINGRLSQRSFEIWRRAPSMARSLFGRFDLVLAQNSGMAQRFIQLGSPNVHDLGNLKIDSPPPPVDELELHRLRGSIGERAILLATSTHPGEEQILAKAHLELAKDMPDLLTIIAPRHPERAKSIDAELSNLGLSVTWRSKGDIPDGGTDVYLADTIGELGIFYSLADIALIGGSLVPKGGQNPIEAMKLDCAVITGPHWRNFRDAYKELLRIKGCHQVADADELVTIAKTLLSDEEALKDLKAAAHMGLGNLSGALEQTVAELAAFLSSSEDLKRVS